MHRFVGYDKRDDIAEEISCTDRDTSNVLLTLRRQKNEDIRGLTRPTRLLSDKRHLPRLQIETGLVAMKSYAGQY